MRNLHSCLLALFLLVTGSRVLSQSLPVGTPLVEDYLRTSQLKGDVDSAVSFTVRPLYPQAASAIDSLYGTDRFPRRTNAVLALPKKALVTLLPITLVQQFNSHHPYGWNDGAMIPAKGYQQKFSAGLYARLGHLTVQLQPEWVFAANPPYPAFPARHSDSLWKSYYNNYLNVIDAPERFGDGSYRKLFPGQSSIRFNGKKISVGLSTENLWWGPGVRNSLIMTNNAPGFPHLTLNTTAPLLSPIGSFEGQLISGLLMKSGYLPSDTARKYANEPLFVPKPAGRRYLNGMVLTWQPKWTKGLFVGFARVFYLYEADRPASLNGYLPVFGQLFKGSLRNALQEDSLKRDQLLSFFFRWLLPKERVEIYAEYGRNDFAGNSRDFLLEPEHSRAYVLGFRKVCTTPKGTDLELWAELTSLQVPSTVQLREVGGWYGHYQVRDGYTHLGQVIGAGIGGGASSQSFGLNWLKGIGKTGVLLERIVRNNDFYYNAFAESRDYWSHWVDLSINLTKSWRHQRFLYEAKLSLVKSFNYEWQRYKDVHHFQAAFSVSYLL